MEAAPVFDRSEHYCIIGAGPAGLIAARALKHARLPYEQYDRNDDVGGLWDIKNAWSPVYESAHFISSKTMSHVPGFPMPEEYPDYPNHRMILAYVRSFARAYDLYPPITFNTSVERVEQDGEHWIVTFDDRRRRRYRGLVLCSGISEPILPSYPGEFAGESMHSIEYRSPELFEGKRVLIVGGGNSACDLACDAAGRAAKTFISMRRGYHFIPKYILGTPADVFANGVSLPYWVERPLFELLLRVVVGDLRRFGLPKPDHPVLATHPILNTQILHHLGHGDLTYRPDVSYFEGDGVHFEDGSNEEVDLVVFATGYRVSFPYMDESLFEMVGSFPDLYLSAFHREFDNLCCLGLHQSNGDVYEFSNMAADMMCNFILDQRENSKRAARFRELKRTDRPDLTGGIPFVKSARHLAHIENRAFRRYSNKLMREFGWRPFGTEIAREPVAVPGAA